MISAFLKWSAKIRLLLKIPKVSQKIANSQLIVQQFGIELGRPNQAFKVISFFDPLKINFPS